MNYKPTYQTNLSPAAISTTSPKIDGTKRRLKLLLFGMLLFLAWASFTFWGQIDSLQQQRDELAKLKIQLADTQQKNKQSMLQVKRLNDLEYIEQLARKEYFFSKPGDTLINIVPNTKP